MAFGLRPRKGLVNDINPHAINFYQWLQQGLPVSLEMRNDETLYYQHRERFNHLVHTGETDNAEAAQLFYYLNRTGFNGLCRFNSKGEFNVPFGRHKSILYRRDFDDYSPILRNWQFVSGDFDQIPLKKNDFVYADPPYDVEFTQYSKENFRWEDQVRLAEWLAKCPGIVVLSNQATDRILQLYRKLKFQLKLLQGPRRISCTGDRNSVQEVLAVRGIEQVC